MQNSISDLGKKYGREKQAEAVITKLDKRLLAFKRVKGKERTDSTYFIRCAGKLFSSNRAFLYWRFSEAIRWQKHCTR